MKRGRTWMAVVPMILLLGLASGWLSNSGYGNDWFDHLRKPAFMPPGWAFPVAWTTLYILMGLALARVMESAHPKRRAAIGWFVAQFLVNLSWSPIFFGLHDVQTGMVIIVALIVLVAITVWLFRRIDQIAGALLLPYLAWLFFAASLNAAILRLNG